MGSTGKEILAIKLIYHVAHLMKDSFQQLHRKPTTDLWKTCTRDFLGEISRRMKGAFDEYAIKIALDGILITPRQHIGFRYTLLFLFVFVYIFIWSACKTEPLKIAFRFFLAPIGTDLAVLSFITVGLPPPLRNRFQRTLHLFIFPTV